MNSQNTNESNSQPVESDSISGSFVVSFSRLLMFCQIAVAFIIVAVVLSIASNSKNDYSGLLNGLAMIAPWVCCIPLITEPFGLASLNRRCPETNFLLLLVSSILHCGMRFVAFTFVYWLFKLNPYFAAKGPLFKKMLIVLCAIEIIALIISCTSQKSDNM